MESLAGKVAVVTGAASGIGLALAQALSTERAHVVMADIDPVRLTSAAGTIERDGDTELLAISTDVGSWESVHALAERVHAHFGAVDLLCNNAGVQRAGRLWKVPPADFQWLLSVNLLGAFHGIRAFVPAMIARGEPAHVVNTASISGLLGFARIGAYTASKFAVVGLSESLFRDLQERGAPIGVSVVCPGATATGLGANSAALRGVDGAEAQEPPQGIDPAEVAAAVIDAVLHDRFWILTHPGYDALLSQRTGWMLGHRGPLPAPGLFL